MNKETLYLCLSDDKKDLFLLPKYEVEKSIKGMEEDIDSNLSYSVLGSIKFPSPGIPYLISYKIDNTYYDIIYAESGIEAHNLLLKKPRLKDKSIKITNTLDLRKLITEYYE